MIQLTLWATSCRSNLYTAHLNVPRSWNSLIHTMKLLARSLARAPWASSALPGIVQTRFGHQPQQGTMPKEQGGFSHLVGKGESVTVWTCASPASWCHREKMVPGTFINWGRGSSGGCSAELVFSRQPSWESPPSKFQVWMSKCSSESKKRNRSEFLTRSHSAAAMFRVLLAGPMYWVDPRCLPALSLLF